MTVGGIEPLVLLLSDGSPEARAAAANALFNMAANADNQKLIAKAGGIEPLVLLLSDGSPEAKAAAAKTLFSLACNADNKTLITSRGH